MRKGNTLVIIDMQPRAWGAASQSKLVDAILNEIRKAKNRYAGIIVVEYTDEPTHKRIKAALKGYSHWTTAVKDGCDGSKEVMQAARRCRYNSRRFVVVGVYTEVCVAETVAGLLARRRPPYVRVVKKACSPQGKMAWSGFHDEVAERCTTPARRQLKVG